MADVAFFTRDGDGFRPTGLGVSPWNGHSQNGVSVAGLVAGVLDTVPSPTPMQAIRITLDLLGAVPMETVRPRTRVVREGRRVQLVDFELEAAGRVQVRGSMLRVRTTSTPPVETPPTRAFPERPDPTSRGPWLETRRVAGDFDSTGPGARWVRFIAPVVAGEPLSPLQRALMLADFAAGTGPVLPTRDWSLANLDITLHLSRLPRGEWLLMDCESESAGNGLAVERGRLGDRQGGFGLAALSVFIDRRAEPG